jgi:hypothetical protein
MAAGSNRFQLGKPPYLLPLRLFNARLPRDIGREPKLGAITRLLPLGDDGGL